MTGLAVAAYLTSHLVRRFTSPRPPNPEIQEKALIATEPNATHPRFDRWRTRDGSAAFVSYSRQDSEFALRLRDNFAVDLLENRAVKYTVTFVFAVCRIWEP